MNKTIIKGITIFMVSFFIAIPLSSINSHTYTLGVSNNHEYFGGCAMGYDLSPGYEFTGLEKY
jgi:hypothetical protein